MRTLVCVVLVAGCGFEAPPLEPVPRPPAEHLVVYPGGEGGSAESIAVLPDGDLVVAGCEHGPTDFEGRPRTWRPGAAWATYVARLDPVTSRARWTVRSASPCVGDNWTGPRVAVTSTGTIWLSAVGWGRGPAEPKTAPAVVMAFDADGALGVQHELEPGLRIRALAALPDGGVALAAQSASAREPSAFVAALDARGTERWRTALPGPHPSYVDSMVLAGGELLVAGEVPGTIEVEEQGGIRVARGREGTGFVHALGVARGALRPRWTRHHAGVNVSDVELAVADGTPHVAYKLSLRAGNPWPAGLGLAPPAFSAIVVEPLAGRPAWRRILTGTTHATVEALAGMPGGRGPGIGRLAFVLVLQAGVLETSRGPVSSSFFDAGAYVELATVDGEVVDTRQLRATGDGARVFLRDVIWDGATFAVVGEVRGAVATPAASFDAERGAPLVWRIGALQIAMAGGPR